MPTEAYTNYEVNNQDLFYTKNYIFPGYIHLCHNSYVS